MAPAVFLAMLVVAAVAFAGCGSGDSTTTTGPGTGGSTTTGPQGGGIAHPTGAGEVVLRVATGGGFVPVEYNLTMLPEFSLFGDGRVIVTGPVMAIYPGPALPNLQTTVVSPETMQTILTAAKEAGLFEIGFDYGQPSITDVGTTTFRVTADGTTYTSDVYALGMEEGTTGLSMEQQERRAALNELRGKLMDVTVFTDAELTWEPYDFQALAVHSLPIDPTVTTDPTEVQPNRLEWPLADLATAGEPAQPQGYRRVIVSGEDLATLRPLLGQATQITIWESAGKDYHLYFRPLLPDQAAAAQGA